MTNQPLLDELDAAHAWVCAKQRALLDVIATIDLDALWREDGARDAAHFLAMRYGISEWKARRWIAASYALKQLPAIAQALTDGVLDLDVVVELTRFATPADEQKLIRWAQRVSCAAIRRRGDRAARADLAPVLEADQHRSVSWWYSPDGHRFGLEAELPAAQGAIVATALERMAETIPVMPGEHNELEPIARERRADALVAVCSARIGSDADPDRATVVVHAQLEGLVSGTEGCEIENGPVIHPHTARRLLCSARTQTVVEDASGTLVAVGRMRRDPPAWMVRQVRYRDRECRFPGCGARRFTQAHHIVFWRDGGTTDLDNLVLICSFHHRLVHEYGWSVTRESDGTLRWCMPGGVDYRAGPSPGVKADGPQEPADAQPALEG